MPTFIAIGYGDQSGYERTERSVRDRAHAHDEQLLKDGAIMGPPQSPCKSEIRKKVTYNAHQVRS